MGQLKYLHEPDTVELRAISLKPQPPYRLPKPIDVVCVLLPLFAILLWSVSLKSVNIQDMNDLGLLSVFPPSIIIALIILTISFCLTLRQPRVRTPLIVLHLVLLIFMLYSVTALVEQMPRFSTVYRHAGYTEYIMRTGSVDPGLDAYFNWPGFFVLSALITRLAGYHDILSYAAWAPAFFNLIYFGPLYMIFATATTDRRLVWLSLWFFYVTNWIAQDYFSPQGLNFFLYLVIIAILLKWFQVPPGPSRGSHGRPGQRVVLLVILIVIFAFVVYSHPLTPFFVLVSVTALVIFRRCAPFWLPILMAIMTGAWILFMTQTFLAGHSDMVLGTLGNISDSITANVTNRVVEGNQQHTFVAEIRVVMTIALWGFAFIGGVRRWRQGHRDMPYILLALAPFPLIVVQDYGGEMFLRVYLFALPLMAFFAATLFYTTHRLSIRGTSPWITAAFIVTSIFLIGGFLVTRYGNERMDYMTYDEVAGVRHLYSIAPANSLLIQAWDGTPWQFQDYEQYNCYSLTDIPAAVANGNVDAIVQYIDSKFTEANPHSYAYIIFTRSQKATSESFAGLPSGTLNRLEVTLVESGKFKLIYSNPDAQVLTFIGGIESAQR